MSAVGGARCTMRRPLTWHGHPATPDRHPLEPPLWQGVWHLYIIPPQPSALPPTSYLSTTLPHTSRWGEGGGGGLTLSLGIVWKVHPPFFGHGQLLVLQSLNIQPPLFMEAQWQPIHIITYWWIYFFIWFNFTRLLSSRGFWATLNA